MKKHLLHCALTRTLKLKPNELKISFYNETIAIIKHKKNYCKKTF